MKTCQKCGTLLNRGNIQVVRKKGKRPYRIHRRCPGKTSSVFLEIAHNYPPSQEFIDEIVPKPQFTGKPDYGEIHSWKGISKPGREIMLNDVEVTFDYPPPPRYRFFLTPATAEKLRESIEKGDAWFWGFASDWSAGIRIEVVPVLEEIAESNPEAVANYVEVEFKWKTD